MNHQWRQQWIIWTSKYFTVIDHYKLREIRATDAAALCVFYNKALGAESKAHFQPLGQQTDDTTCMRIASGRWPVLLASNGPRHYIGKLGK